MGRVGTRLLLLVVSAFVLAGCLNPAQQEVFDLVNHSRAANGLPPLEQSEAANQKAQAWAEHLAATGQLAHSELRAGMASVSWHRLGENVGYHTNGTGAVHQAYMNSSTHRANILGSWTHLGVGYATANGRTYTVHVFVDQP